MHVSEIHPLLNLTTWPPLAVHRSAARPSSGWNKPYLVMCSTLLLSLAYVGTRTWSFSNDVRTHTVYDRRLLPLRNGQKIPQSAIMDADPSSGPNWVLQPSDTTTGSADLPQHLPTLSTTRSADPNSPTSYAAGASSSGAASATKTAAAAASAQSTSSKPRPVPRIMHHMHASLSALSPVQRKLYTKCKEMHPQWQMYFWDDAALDTFVREKFAWYYPTWSEIHPLIKKLDSSRYMLMHHFGGVYMDVDVECVTPLDSLIEPLPPGAAWMGDFPEPMFVMSSPGAKLWLTGGSHC
jgi:hypothetical protein